MSDKVPSLSVMKLYVKSFGSCFAKTSTPNASIEPQVACTTSMPNISVTDRSTSVPELVSEASISDLYSHFKRCCTSKDETFQINTIRIIGRPYGSPRISCPRKYPTSCPKNDLRACPSKGSLNNFLPRDSMKLKKSPKKLPRVRFIKGPKKTGSSEEPLRIISPQGSRTSLNNFLPKDSSKTSVPNRSTTIHVPKESPKGSKESLRSCHPKERCKRCSKQKRITSKCRCTRSSEVVSSDEALADKCECVEELYFNNEAKKSGGSSPRGHSSKEKSCDFLKDSGATSSLMDSSANYDATAKYYHNKLLATLQVLQNKEETISVQADSLVVAEERIAALNERANELKRELDRKIKENSLLRKSVEYCQPVQKHDVCLFTDRSMEDQTEIVNTLENNLSVIEDLYRECFYETAKQENLIEMLRCSYWDVRLCDRQKAEQIGRLQTVINSQQSSLNRCQDIALEVDGLKMEISNFLNSSSSTNNDSGMWERSEESYAPAPGVQDDLHDVREQLLRLQDLLAFDSCTCGLEDENMKLKKKAESLEIKISGLQKKLGELECTLSSKCEAEAKCEADIELKEQELARTREQLIRSQDKSRDQSSTVESFSIQMGQMKALLCEKTDEVRQLRQENEAQANKIKDLEEELDKADHIIKENCKMRSEVAYLTTQVQLWRAQLDESKRRVHALEKDLAHTRTQAAHINSCYREKASNVAELQAHLEQAHERGTALCGEARRAVCAVRMWMRRMREKHREKDNILKEKESLISALQRRLEEKQNDSQCTSASENTTSCSKCLSSRDAGRFSFKTGVRRGQCQAPSVSEMPSCSSSSAQRPMRLLRKKPNGGNVWVSDQALQEPVRRDAYSEAIAGPFCRHYDVRHVRLTPERRRTPRDVSPTEDLLLRVEQLSQALADSNRRWTRPRDAR